MKVDLESGLLRLPAPPRASRPDTEEQDFGQALLDAIGKMDAVAARADTSAEGLVTGQTSLHEAMVAMEKANLVLQLGTTVRNKLLDAYQQIMSSSG